MKLKFDVKSVALLAALSLMLIFIFSILAGDLLYEPKVDLPKVEQLDQIQEQLDDINASLDGMMDGSELVVKDDGLLDLDAKLSSIITNIGLWLSSTDEESELTARLQEMMQLAVDTQYRITIGIKTGLVPNMPS